MQQEVDDISDGLPPFNKDKWIGKGQNFVTGLERRIYQQCHTPQKENGDT